jgi:hypothetical protein
LLLDVLFHEHLPFKFGVHDTLMLWLFDCQRAFAYDVLNRKTVHDVVNVII